MSDDPTQRTSEEVDDRQLELSSDEGDAYLESLEYMATEVAHAGDTQRAGDYVVGFAQEEAEGMYVLTDEATGTFEWVEPTDENCHLEVAVADADDGRFVPYATVIATFESEAGDRTGPFEIPFVWHPGLHHYGRNVELPGEGAYTIELRVEPPHFKRHDEENGDRYGEAVAVTFDDVDIETGRD